MSQELKASYYSGIKPQAKLVTVLLESQQFRIQFDHDHLESDRIWEVEKIKPDLVDDDGKFILRYGSSHPYEFLEFNDLEAYNYLIRTYPGKKWKQTGSASAKNPLIVLGFIISLFIVLGVGIYFLLVPKISDALARKIPLKWEVDLGNKMSDEILKSSHEDITKSKMLDSFFLRMDIPSKYSVRFHFINDSIVNAYAMPGGNIVIYKGLFDKINSYESLAALIGHEYTHIQNRHSLRAIFRSLSSFIILAAFFGDLTGLAGIIFENANTIQNLSYSRDFEREADANSIDLLVARKIGLTGMLDLFNVFLKDGKKGLEIPNFLNTHPVTEERIAFVKSRMSQKESELFNYVNLAGLFNRLKNN